MRCRQMEIKTKSVFLDAVWIYGASLSYYNEF